MVRSRSGGVIYIIVELAHMIDGTQQMGGSNIIVELAHMIDLHTWLMHVDAMQRMGGSNIIVEDLRTWLNTVD